MKHSRKARLTSRIPDRSYQRQSSKAREEVPSIAMVAVVVRAVRHPKWPGVCAMVLY